MNDIEAIIAKIRHSDLRRLVPFDATEFMALLDKAAPEWRDGLPEHEPMKSLHHTSQIVERLNLLALHARHPHLHRLLETPSDNTTWPESARFKAAFIAYEMYCKTPDWRGGLLPSLKAVAVKLVEDEALRLIQLSAVREPQPVTVTSQAEGDTLTLPPLEVFEAEQSPMLNTVPEPVRKDENPTQLSADESWREKWGELSDGGKIGVIVIVGIVAALWIAYAFAIAWYLYPALAWWQVVGSLVAVAVSIAVVVRAFLAFAPDFSKKAGYVLSPIITIISLPVIVVGLVLLLVAAGVWFFLANWNDRQRTSRIAVTLIVLMVAGMAGFVVLKRSVPPSEAAQVETLNNVWK